MHAHVQVCTSERECACRAHLLTRERISLGDCMTCDLPQISAGPVVQKSSKEFLESKLPLVHQQKL